MQQAYRNLLITIVSICLSLHLNLFCPLEPQGTKVTHFTIPLNYGPHVYTIRIPQAPGGVTNEAAIGDILEAVSHQTGIPSCMLQMHLCLARRKGVTNGEPVHEPYTSYWLHDAREEKSQESITMIRRDITTHDAQNRKLSIPRDQEFIIEPVMAETVGPHSLLQCARMPISLFYNNQKCNPEGIVDYKSEQETKTIADFVRKECFMGNDDTLLLQCLHCNKNIPLQQKLMRLACCEIDPQRFATCSALVRPIKLVISKHVPLSAWLGKKCLDISKRLYARCTTVYAAHKQAILISGIGALSLYCAFRQRTLLIKAVETATAQLGLRHIPVSAYRSR